MRRRSFVIGITIAVAAFTATSASATDDPRFRRTTPRGSFGRDGAELLVGIPGGRAWGIESELRLVPAELSPLRATIEVRDPTVREAFVRVAWYDRATGRPRQFALTDARAVHDGESRTLEVPLDPPPGAVAYRLRVLARLDATSVRSVSDAVRVRLAGGAGWWRVYPESSLLP